MAQLITAHPASGCFGTRFASEHGTGTGLTEAISPRHNDPPTYDCKDQTHNENPPNIGFFRQLIFAAR
jgi:hypothetical protein